MSSRLLLGLLIGLLLAVSLGCSAPPPDGQRCLPAAVSPPYDPTNANNGRYVGPEEFDQSECVPGSLAGFDFTGVWPEIGYRLAPGCGNGLGVYSGTYHGESAVFDVRLSDDWLFIREGLRYGSTDYLYATLICNVSPEGALLGKRIACYDGECFGIPWSVAAKRFARMPGEADADGLTVLSTFAGNSGARWPMELRTANVRVRDGMAYVARGEDGLRIVDVSDPRHPYERGALAPATADLWNDVKVVATPDGRTYALMAGQRDVVAVNVTDPAAPVVDAIFASAIYGAHSLFVEERGATRLVYAVDGTNPVVEVFDVTEPARPVRLGMFYDPSLTAFHDLYVADGIAYVNATGSGLVVLDATDPAQMFVLGTTYTEDYSHSNWVTTAGGRKVTVHGGEGFGDHLKVIDVDPASPLYLQIIGEWKTRAETSIHNIVAVGNRAYVAYYEDGVRVLDLSDPTAPQQIAYANTFEPDGGTASIFEGAFSLDVDPTQHLIYVADSQHGLMVLHEDR